MIFLVTFVKTYRRKVIAGSMLEANLRVFGIKDKTVKFIFGTGASVSFKGSCMACIIPEFYSC